MKRSTPALVLATAYFSLVIFSIAYAIYRVKFAPENSELTGVPSLILTLPWSMAAFSLIDNWLSNSLAVTTIVIIICGMINSAIIYTVAAWTAKLISGSLDQLPR